jgi:hypothetical protein
VPFDLAKLSNAVCVLGHAVITVITVSSTAAIPAFAHPMAYYTVSLTVGQCPTGGCRVQIKDHDHAVQCIFKMSVRVFASSKRECIDHHPFSKQRPCWTADRAQAKVTMPGMLCKIWQGLDLHDVGCGVGPTLLSMCVFYSSKIDPINYKNHFK